MRRIIVCLVCLCLGCGCCLNHAEGEIVIGEPIEQPAAQERLAAEIDNYLSFWEFKHLMVYGADLQFWRLFASTEIARFASGSLGLTAGSPVMFWSAVHRTVDNGRTALWGFLRWLNS